MSFTYKFVLSWDRNEETGVRNLSHSSKKIPLIWKLHCYLGYFMIPLWLLLSASFLSLTHLTPAPLPPATLNSKPQEGFFTPPPLCMHCYVCQGCWNQVFCFCLPQPHCPSSGAAPKIPLATHDLSNSLTAPGLKMDMWTLLANQAWLEWLVEIGMDVYKPAGRIVKPWEGQRWSAKDLLWTPGSNRACSPTCRRHSHRQLASPSLAAAEERVNFLLSWYM